MSKNKNATMIALFMIFTVAIALINFLPSANAARPKASWIYIVAAPNPVGVGQSVNVVWWTDVVPPTPHANEQGGSWGDLNHWHGVTVEITAPNGAKRTEGPMMSDPVGGGWFTFTPDQIGEYTFQATWPGEWKNFTLPTQSVPTSLPAGDYWFPGCTSEISTLTVQEEQLVALSAGPLPTDYWTRPINAYNRQWSQLAGSWLADGSDNLWTKAPDTAHIMWTKPLFFGGIVGGQYEDLSYHTGSAYETKWSPPIIMNGVLYYNVPRSDSTSSSVGSFAAVDLRSGEQLWEVNGTRISMGQLLEYDSPNQHGVHPYLWVTGGTSHIYDAFSGSHLFTIRNVPSGTAAVGPMGERLIYQMNVNGRWLAMWNATSIPALWGAANGTCGWQWRPVGKNVDGNVKEAWMWNVTIPDLTISGADPQSATGPAIYRILSDRIIGTTGLRSFQYGTMAYSIWCLSLEEGREGTLKWQKTYPAPAVVNGTMIMQDVDLESKVFVMRLKEERQLYGYDLDTGNKIWGPTESFDEYAMYGFGSEIRDGVLYLSTNYEGKMFALNVKTGEQIWEWDGDVVGLDGPYERWPLTSPEVVDGKLYNRGQEHSHTHPLYMAWKMYCVDAESGKSLWNFSGLWHGFAFADGYMINFNAMDNQIYCFGKGSSATTVSASPEVSVNGDSVLVKGTVTDQAPGAVGTPAIADEYMTEWMEYL